LASVGSFLGLASLLSFASVLSVMSSRSVGAVLASGGRRPSGSVGGSAQPTPFAE
jgi:hypothetical protein